MSMTTPMAANQPTLTPEERVRFRQVYDAQLQERYGTHLPTAAERLTFTRELLHNWRRGQACVGATLKYVTLNAAALTDPAVVDARIRATGQRPTYLPYLLLVGAMALLGLWVVLSGAGSARRGAAVRVPTPLPGTPLLTPPPATAVTGFIVVGQRTPTALSPDSLELAGRSFVVYNAPVDKDKNWLVASDPNYANWLAGSIVNWTFALMLQEDTGADRPAFLARLREPGLSIMLRVRSDEGVVTTHTFRTDGVRGIKRTDTDVFDIRVPGLTVIVRSDDSDQRLYLHGTEILTPAPTASTQADPADPTNPPRPTVSLSPTRISVP